MATAKTKKDDLVPIYIPKDYQKDDTAYVFINHKRWTIQKGKVVQVPSIVAELVENSLAQKEEAQAYVEQMERRAMERGL